MSEIYAGESIVFDPNDKRVINFDWDSEALETGVTISSSAWTITAVRQSGATALTSDNAGLVTGNRITTIRLLATTATIGDKYWVSNKITTNESPSQEIEQRFQVLVQDH